MIEVLSVKNMRDSDAHTIASGTSGRELMMRAGKAIFENVDWKPPVAIICGSGNNAGDGYVLAKLLHDADIPCTLIMLEEKFSADGRHYYDICRENGIESRLWEQTGSEPDPGKYSTIVDCIFGTGFRGEVHGKAAEAINAINSSGAYVVSVDINSGLNGDCGMADLCVASDLTVSIGSFKPGHFLNMAKDVMKKKIDCDIGITAVERPYYLLESSDLRPYFTPRPNFSNKGTYGYVALIGGSKRYSGAICLAAMANDAISNGHSRIAKREGINGLSEMANIAVSNSCSQAAGKDELFDLAAAANAAMRSGAGVVKIAVPNSLCPIAATHVLESTLFPLSDEDSEVKFVESEIAELISNVKTVAFGMGIGVTEETAKILNYLLENYTGKLIIDADGLTLLSRMNTERILNSKPQLVLTPHIKEFSRLLEGWERSVTGHFDEMQKNIPDPVIERIQGAKDRDSDGKDPIKRNNTDISKKYDIDSILSTPIEYAEKYARAHKVTLLLKGPSTIITDGDITYITDTGCAGMATAGSGDVLSGILAAVCAYIPGKIAFSVAAGAYINGKAGELAQEKVNSISMTASDTVLCIAEAIKNLCN